MFLSNTCIYIYTKTQHQRYQTVKDIYIQDLKAQHQICQTVEERTQHQSCWKAQETISECSINYDWTQKKKPTSAASFTHWTGCCLPKPYPSPSPKSGSKPHNTGIYKNKNKKTLSNTQHGERGLIKTYQNMLVVAHPHWPSWSYIHIYI